MQGALAERACFSEGDTGRQRGLKDLPSRISLSASQNIAQVLILVHGKFFHLNDLHIDRGHSHVGVIKTLCLLMLSWIFTGEFWLRVGPKAVMTQCRRRPVVLMRFFTDERREHSCRALLFFCQFVTATWWAKSFPWLQWNNMSPLTQIIIFRWSFKLVDFYLQIFSSNFLPFKWKPTDKERHSMIEEILAHSPEKDLGRNERR